MVEMEIGARYRTRGGDITKKLKASGHAKRPFVTAFQDGFVASYTAEGRYWQTGESANDLIEKLPPKVKKPAPTPDITESAAVAKLERILWHIGIEKITPGDTRDVTYDNIVKEMVDFTPPSDHNAPPSSQLETVVTLLQSIEEELPMLRDLASDLKDVKREPVPMGNDASLQSIINEWRKKPNHEYRADLLLNDLINAIEGTGAATYDDPHMRECANHNAALLAEVRRRHSKWEGDTGLAADECLSSIGNVLQNFTPPLSVAEEANNAAYQKIVALEEEKLVLETENRQLLAKWKEAEATHDDVMLNVKPETYAKMIGQIVDAEATLKRVRDIYEGWKEDAIDNYGFWEGMEKIFDNVEATQPDTPAPAEPVSPPYKRGYEDMLIAALGFYADAENYTDKRYAKFNPETRQADSYLLKPVVDDNGTMARDTLTAWNTRVQPPRATKLEDGYAMTLRRITDYLENLEGNGIGYTLVGVIKDIINGIVPVLPAPQPPRISNISMDEIFTAYEQSIKAGNHSDFHEVIHGIIQRHCLAEEIAQPPRVPNDKLVEGIVQRAYRFAYAWEESKTDNALQEHEDRFRTYLQSVLPPDEPRGEVIGYAVVHHNIQNGDYGIDGVADKEHARRIITNNNRWKHIATVPIHIPTTPTGAPKNA